MEQPKDASEKQDLPSATEKAAPQALNSFALFPKLPAELRIEIWTHIVNTSRHVNIPRWGEEIQKGRRILPRGEKPALSAQLLLKERSPSQYPVPPILHICSELRRRALKSYTLFVQDFKDSLPEGVQPAPYGPGCPQSLSKDRFPTYITRAIFINFEVDRCRAFSARDLQFSGQSRMFSPGDVIGWRNDYCWRYYISDGGLLWDTEHVELHYDREIEQSYLPATWRKIMSEVAYLGLLQTFEVLFYLFEEVTESEAALKHTESLQIDVVLLLQEWQKERARDKSLPGRSSEDIERDWKATCAENRGDETLFAELVMLNENKRGTMRSTPGMLEYIRDQKPHRKNTRD